MEVDATNNNPDIGNCGGGDKPFDDLVDAIKEIIHSKEQVLNTTIEVVKLEIIPSRWWKGCYSFEMYYKHQDPNDKRKVKPERN